MKVNGSIRCEMVMASNSGQIIQNIMDSGRKTKQMDTGSYTMLMVMFMKVNGSMTRLMDRVLTLMPMDLSIQVPGKMINKMVMGQKLGAMERFMKESTKTGKNMEKVNLYSQINQYIKEISS